MVVILTAFSFMFCGGSKEEQSKKVALLISNRSNEFFSILENSILKNAKEKGYEVEVYDASNDATKQPGQVEDAIVKGVGAIIINPLNQDATQSVLNDAVSKGIAVLTVDTTVQGVNLLAEIATDNEDGGKFAAEWLVKKSNLAPSDLAGIVHMKGIDGHSAHIARYNGFNKYLKSEEAGTEWSELANNAEKYMELTGNFAQDVAQSVFESKLSALNPEGQYVVYCENDVMAIGVIGAIENDDRFSLSNFKITGFDGSAEGKKLVDEGKLLVTVVQDFEFIGKKAILVLDDFITSKIKPESPKTAIEVVMYPENQNPRK